MSDIAMSIADSMPPLSHLECTVCHEKQELGDTAEHFRSGWPECHGYTMRLVTKAELNSKEDSDGR